MGSTTKTKKADPLNYLVMMFFRNNVLGVTHVLDVGVESVEIKWKLIYILHRVSQQ